MTAASDYIQGLLRAIRSRPDLQYLFIIAFALRFFYFALILGQVIPSEMLTMSPDVQSYISAAHGFLGWQPMNEHALFIFGPGYGFFLSVCFLLFGTNAPMVIFVQIILSSVSCLLIYKLALELTGVRMIGLIAGYLSATSFTSISLANILLSDTVFFFIFLSGNVLFIRGLRLRSRKQCVYAGLVLSYAVLCRSMAQFWVIALVVFILVWPIAVRQKPWIEQAKRLFKIAYVTPLIVLMVISAWIIRNDIVHDLPILAFAGLHGLSKVTANAQSHIYNHDLGAVYGDWVEQYRKMTGKGELDFKDNYNIIRLQTFQTLTSNPWEFIKAYFNLMRDNIVASNELYYVQLPKHKNHIIPLYRRLQKWNYTTICFCLTIIGFLLMWLKYKRAFWVLGILYLYVCIMVGFGQWQGSRLFFPAQIAWAISIACVVHFVYGKARKNYGKLVV